MSIRGSLSALDTQVGGHTKREPVRNPPPPLGRPLGRSTFVARSPRSLTPLAARRDAVHRAPLPVSPSLLAHVRNNEILNNFNSLQAAWRENG
jgi:hypothetical protein